MNLFKHMSITMATHMFTTHHMYKYHNTYMYSVYSFYASSLTRSKNKCFFTFWCHYYYPGVGACPGDYGTITNAHSSSPTSSQISQWLQLIPPWLLISARSGHFCHCSVYNLSTLHSNILKKFGYKEFGEPLAHAYRLKHFTKLLPPLRLL